MGVGGGGGGGEGGRQGGWGQRVDFVPGIISCREEVWVGGGWEGVGGGGVRFGRGFAAPRPPNEGYYVFRG